MEATGVFRRVAGMKARNLCDFRQSVRVGLSGWDGPFHLYVAEAIVSEPGLPAFRAVPFRGVAEPERGAARTLVDGTVRVQQFSGIEFDRLRLPGVQGEMHDAGEVLS